VVVLSTERKDLSSARAILKKFQLRRELKDKKIPARLPQRLQREKDVGKQI
jgi:hypothetical protein